MSKLNSTLNHIYEQLRSVGALLDAVRAENETLKSEIRHLQEVIAIQKNTITDLEDKNKIVKIAEAVQLSRTDKKAAKLKINEFIREIDRCIAVLSE